MKAQLVAIHSNSASVTLKIISGSCWNKFGTQSYCRLAHENVRVLKLNCLVKGSFICKQREKVELVMTNSSVVGARYSELLNRPD